jgi:hypothetical protein
MSLELIALDPNTGGNNCPALFLETDTGDLLPQGYTETAPASLAAIDPVSRVRPGESVVRWPARMRPVLLRALIELEGADAVRSALTELEGTDGGDDRP